MTKCACRVGWGGIPSNHGEGLVTGEIGRAGEHRHRLLSCTDISRQRFNQHERTVNFKKATCCHKTCQNPLLQRQPRQGLICPEYENHPLRDLLACYLSLNKRSTKCVNEFLPSMRVIAGEV